MIRATRLVYIAHPLGNGPDRAENLARAARWCAWAARTKNVLPIAPWIAIASVWPERDDLRARGLMIDKQTIARCDEVWLCGPRISPGMKVEREHAEACGVRVVNRTYEKLVEPPDEPPFLLDPYSPLSHIGL